MAWRLRGAKQADGQGRGGEPLSAYIKLAGGYLTVEDLRQMHLNARLTVLSGCRTRLGNMRFQEHSPGALHRAALVAGSEAVIASRWMVGDQVTYALMKAFYKEFPKTGRAVALARAQRALLESGNVARETHARAVHVKGEHATGSSESVMPYASPWSWAAFSLVGLWD